MRTCASSAPNGSSSSSTSGWTASARASAMRWRWPPDSCDGQTVGELLEVDELEQLVHPLLDLVLRPLADLEAERDVAEDREVLERGVVLEHEADVAPLRRQRRWRRRRRSRPRPQSGSLEPGDDAQQRRLAAAARAEQRGQRPVRDVDGDVVERDEIAEALGHVAHAMAISVLLRAGGR